MFLAAILVFPTEVHTAATLAAVYYIRFTTLFPYRLPLLVPQPFHINARRNPSSSNRFSCIIIRLVSNSDYSRTIEAAPTVTASTNYCCACASLLLVVILIVFCCASFLGIAQVSLHRSNLYRVRLLTENTPRGAVSTNDHSCSSYRHHHHTRLHHQPSGNPTREASSCS